MTVLSRSVCASATCCSATLTCCLRSSIRAFARVEVQLGLLDVGLRSRAGLEELRRALEVDAGLLATDLVLLHGTSGGIHLRLRQVQRRPRGRVVEPREDLALLNGHAFLDVHLDDLAGNLRRHGRAPPGRDVARRVQHRRLGAGRPGGDRRDLYLDGLLTHQPPGQGRAAPQEQHEEHDPRDPAAGRAAVGLAVDLQGSEIGREIRHRKGLKAWRLKGLKASACLPGRSFRRYSLTSLLRLSSTEGLKALGLEA